MEDLFIFIQLAGMGKALFVVARLTPRVTEIHVNAICLFVFRKERIKLFNIIGKQCHIFNRLFAELRFDIAARNTENIHADINADEVHIAVAVRKCRKECTFAAAEVEMQRLFFFEKGLPCTGSLFRLINIERTHGKFRTCPLFCSDSQGSIFLSFLSALCILAQNKTKCKSSFPHSMYHLPLFLLPMPHHGNKNGYHGQNIADRGTIRMA